MGNLYPLVPEDIQHLTSSGIPISVQTTSIRTFSDTEYEGGYSRDKGVYYQQDVIGEP